MSQTELAEYRKTKLDEQLELNKDKARKILENLLAQLSASSVVSTEVSKIIIAS